MGSLGVPEIAFIFILALLIFGPKRLPELGRTVGKGLAEFRKASNELKRTINAELALDELPKLPPTLTQTLTRRVPAGTIAAPLMAAMSALDEPAPPAPTAPVTPDAPAEAGDPPAPSS